MLTDFPAALGMALVLLTIVPRRESAIQEPAQAIWHGAAVGFAFLDPVNRPRSSCACAAGDSAASPSILQGSENGAHDLARVLPFRRPLGRAEQREDFQRRHSSVFIQSRASVDYAATDSTSGLRQLRNEMRTARRRTKRNSLNKQIWGAAPGNCCRTSSSQPESRGTSSTI